MESALNTLFDTAAKKGVYLFHSPRPRTQADKDQLDGTVITWANEHLGRFDLLDSFERALTAQDYIRAHAILTTDGICPSWRVDHFNQWLADHSAA